MSAGEGKVGFCKLCAWEHVRELNKGINSGWNAADAKRWAETRGFTFNRQTFYAHKPHAVSVETAVIQAAEQGKKALTIRKSSNTGFLEAIRDIGFTKAIDDPDKISIDHALKAVQILEGRKDKGGDQIQILVALVTGNAPPITIEPTVIEGTAVEVS